MISQELLDILCCPETKEDVSLIDEAVLGRINQAIAKGGVKNRAGTEVTEPIQSGLLRKDGRFLYPVRDDIPIMLIDESLPMDQFPR
jgi:uncharacterized protein